MSTYSQFLKRKSINLDVSNKCTLECPYCARRRFEIKKDVPGSHMTDHDWKLYLSKFDAFIFCGQLSDPIMHPNFSNMLKDIESENKCASIHVAASHKPKKFYERCFNSSPNSTWIFGIDGLPKDSCKYRKNQNGQKLFEIMLTAKEIVKKVVWQYIVFKYNEKDIDAAKKLAEKHNIEIRFLISSRFGNNDDYYKPSEKFFIKRNDEFVA